MNEKLWTAHFSAHPVMEPIDGVKLAFQSAFGCGHLLADHARGAAYAAAEAARVVQDPLAPLYESIGGGLCRLNLKSPAVRRLSGERIADLMFLTADAVGAGDPSAFDRSLAQLSALARQGRTPFTAEALEDYLAEYRRQGCPVVSHSAAYRAACAPAYRVVKTALAQLVPLLSEADDRLAEHQQAVIVIDGPCAAGKTTLAACLAKLYQTQPISLDDYFLPPDMRTPDRLSQPGGNVHYERFLAEVLQPLSSREDFAFRRFDCATGQMQSRRHAITPVTVIEGSYSHHPAFADPYQSLHAIRLWLDVEQDDQLCRLQARNPEMLQMFRTRWIPLEKTYREAYHIREKADLRLKLEGLP